MKLNLGEKDSRRASSLLVAGLLLLGLLLRGLVLTHPGYAPDIAFWKSYLSYSTVFGIEHVYSMETGL